MKDIVIASGNAGKIKEFAYLLQAYACLTQTHYILPNETASSFIENALDKARYTSQYVSGPVLADDSGLCVPALGYQPGIYSARYDAKEQFESCSHKLLNAMQDVKDRRAFFICTLVIMRQQHDPIPIIAYGYCYGNIAMKIMGDQGFGYDPIFIPDGFNVTMAQLPFEKKQSISHRAHAAESILKQWPSL